MSSISSHEQTWLMFAADLRGLPIFHITVAQENPHQQLDQEPLKNLRNLIAAYMQDTFSGHQLILVGTVSQFIRASREWKKISSETSSVPDFLRMLCSEKTGLRSNLSQGPYQNSLFALFILELVTTSRFLRNTPVFGQFLAGLQLSYSQLQFNPANSLSACMNPSAILEIENTLDDLGRHQKNLS